MPTARRAFAHDPVHQVTTYIPWPIEEGTGLLQDEVPHPYGIHGVLEDRGHVMTRFVMRTDMTGLLYDVPVE